VLLVWLLNAATLYLLTLALPGLAVASARTALVATAVIGLLNAVLWPLLLRVLLPVIVYTLGLAALLLNGAVVWSVGQVVEGVTVASLWTAIAAAVALTAVSSWVSGLLAIDDEESYYRSFVLRLAGRPRPVPSDAPGVFFLEIDGLAHAILLRAIRNGHLPTLARWLRTGTHRLHRWECDLSSQTAASQSGILLGDNFDVPAFRWYEKDTGRTVVTSSPESAAELERRLSTGTGLLAQAGASRGNVFSGDAPHVLLTLSTIRDRARFHADSFTPLFARAYSFIRLLLLFFGELIQEWVEARRQRRWDIYPRVGRGWPYPFLRAFTTVILREITVYTLIGDLFAGVPVAYATFAGYDEVAHHSGPEREDAIRELEVIDRQFARLEDAAALAPRPYHFVVLSDHGQSQGATFRQRYGLTLRQLVDQLTAGQVNVAAPPSTDKAWGYLDAALTESVGAAGAAGAAGGVPGRAPGRLLQQAMERGAAAAREANAGVAAGAAGTAPEPEAPPPAAPLPEPPPSPPSEMVVLASGNLGLIYCSTGQVAGVPAGAPAGPQRMTLEELEAAFPALLRGLATHPGIGFVLVRSAVDGLLAIGAGGVHYLDSDRVEGHSPLRPFGPNAVRHLRHAATFPHGPDILVNSLYDPQHDEVAAFEELVGSHGGVGGDQSFPFVLFPAAWPLPEVESAVFAEGAGGADAAAAPIVGAVALHHALKGWLHRLGLAPAPAPPVAPELPAGGELRPAAPSGGYAASPAPPAGP
jgi:uncharacterized membrane protein YvlD (DUF360 family)